ncbi:MAG: carboxypeptidase-like regulatory domain-containing protein [Candidatus Sulfotelmatobacter sp.]
MNIYSQDGRGCGSVAALSLLTVAMALGGSNSYGQSPATVTGQVQLPDGETKKGLRVRAIPKSSGAKSKTRELTKGDFNYTTHVYTYTIERLQPGKYDFVLCDGLDYRPGLQTQTVQAGQALTIDFLLQDQPKGHDKIANVLTGPEGRLVGRDYPVFLKHVATGCTVAEASTGPDGKYEFDGLPRGEYEVTTEEADQDP